MIFVDPVLRVGEEEVPHRSSMLTVEVDRVSPLVGVAIGEVVLRELFEIVAVRSEMVVDDVENDADPDAVSLIDEAPEVVGRPVESRRREEIHAVITPAEAAGKVGDRHELDHGDSDARQLWELAGSRRPRAFRRERAHVHFVDHLAVKSDSAPRDISPPKRRWVENARGAVRTFRLKARSWIRDDRTV